MRQTNRQQNRSALHAAITETGIHSDHPAMQKDIEKKRLSLN